MTPLVYVGADCKQGHGGLRYQSSRGCVACAADSQRSRTTRSAICRAYYHRHKDQIAKRFAAKYVKKSRPPAKGLDPIKRRIRSKRYDDGHRAEKRERAQLRRIAWREETLERERAYRKTPTARAVQRAYRQRHPDRVKARTHARRARQARCEGKYTGADITAIRLAQADRCVYCGVPLGGRGSIDHIIPITRGGTNWPSNVQLTCKPCNSSKHNKLPHEFRAAVRKHA